MAETPLLFPAADAVRLEPHLPPLAAPATAANAPDTSSELPFVTLTFATSLDSALSLGPGIRTALSGPRSKAMTHYLRSRHDAICVGVGTAVADDPGLNCRLAAASDARADTSGPSRPSGLSMTSSGAADVEPVDAVLTSSQPRPIVVDPRLRWDFTPESKVIRLAREGRGLAPFIVTTVEDLPAEKKRWLEEVGGKFILIKQQGAISSTTTVPSGRRLDWRVVLAAVRREGLRSLMIEGGGQVINSLLSHEYSCLLDSVILTIAPTWLGPGSVFVSPPREATPDGNQRPAARLTDTTWMPLGEDVVLCGRIAK
ncbi:putative riboflavin biosynthesis protein Rib7 [Xylariaceae sp. FL0804]|nr:putative riboflavin biosynthesis protein Rib7 [Xylariaceae sp. FL0804]